ncbi:ankyrin repeat domain-containing protein [Myxococcota bacterium]|nr:ankyrin repeat domain-containing protein [Myxococcota bacterium]
MDVETAIQEIEGVVGPLPEAYATFLRTVGAGVTRHFTDAAGSRKSIYFYRPAAVLDEIQVAPVDAGSGLLVIGTLGPHQYVLDVGTGSLWLWDYDEQDVAELIARVDRLVPVDRDIAHFLGHLEPPPAALPEHPLKALAQADLDSIDRFLASNPPAEDLATFARQAARAGRVDVVERCLGRGCAPDTLVGAAILGGHLPMVRYLIEDLGIDPTKDLNKRVLSTPDVRKYLEQYILKRR